MGKYTISRQLKNHSRSILFSIAAVFLIVAAHAQASPQPGTVDTNFNANGIKPTSSVIVQPDGRILVGNQRLLADGSPDLTFAVNLPAGAKAAALQPDGKILIAGEFLSFQGVSRPCLARVDTNGVLDTSFVPQLITTNPPPLPPPNPPRTSTNHIGSVLLQTDGKILIGDLENILATNGSALPDVIRLNSDGSVDDTFGITNSGVPSALQSDGKILLMETVFTNLSSVGSTVRRLNTNGTLDPTFIPPTINGWVNLVVPLNGKLVLAGGFSRVNGVKSSCIARLLLDGSLDTSFHSDVYQNSVGISAILPEPDGGLLIGGGVGFPNVSNQNFGRLNGDGSFDATYATNGANSYVFWFARQPDGNVLAGGDFTILNGTPVSYFARVYGDTGTGPGWVQFDPGAYEISEGVGLATLTLRRTGGTQGDVTVNYHTKGGSAVEGADYTGQSGVVLFHDGETQQTISIPISDDAEIEDLESFQVVLTNPTAGANLGIASTATVSIQDNDGPASMDAGFTVPLDSLDNGVQSIALQSDGKILIGGAFQQAGRELRIGVARLQTDGSLDETFDPGSGLSFNGSLGNARLIRIQDDGRILIAGAFTTVNGTNRNHLARLNSNGSLDTTFDVGAGAVMNNTVADIRGIALTSSNIIVGGGFTTFNSINRNGLARLDGSGAVDLSYNPSGGQPIMPFGLQTDGKVVYSSLYSNKASRINADGSPDNLNFATVNNAIYSVQSLSNGNTLIAGVFTNVSGMPRLAIARLLSNGAVDSAFIPDLGVFLGGIASPYIYLFTPQDDGKVLIAVKSFQPPVADYLARLNSDGSLDTDFEPVSFAIPAGNNDTISAITVQPDGRILVGGIFQSVNGLEHPYLVRLRGGGKSGARRVAIKSLAISSGQPQITMAVSPGKPFVLQTTTNFRCLDVAFHKRDSRQHLYGFR